MELHVGRYLSRRLQSPPSSLPPPPVTNGSLVLVETRVSFFLLDVVHDALTAFPDWPLWLVGPSPVLEHVTSAFPGRDIRSVRLDDVGARGSPKLFSDIMFSPAFWALFTPSSSPYVMIFQTDSVFAPDARRKLRTPTKDFYGAACGTLTDDSFVINGGLSLRRVEAFRAAVAYLTPEDRALPEDVAFCGVMRRHPEFQLPDMAECMAFAIESFGDPSRVVGIHGTDKYYCPPALSVATLWPLWPLHPARKIIDVFSYDGEPIALTRLKLLDCVTARFVIIEARVTHSGLPKTLRYDPAAFAAWAHKITYIVIDAFPPAPPGFGADMPWVDTTSRESVDAWWRENYQRDTPFVGAHAALTTYPDATPVLVSDVDEIPDPSVLLRVLDTLPPDGATYLGMAFLVHSPRWRRPLEEPWSRAFISRLGWLRDPGVDASFVRCSTPDPSRVVPRAGWHCTSFFDVDAQIRKINNFAHREFAAEIDPALIRERFETGRDPYGRGPYFDCVRTSDFDWLAFV